MNIFLCDGCGEYIKDFEDMHHVSISMSVTTDKNDYYRYHYCETCFNNMKERITKMEETKQIILLKKGKRVF